MTAAVPFLCHPLFAEVDTFREISRYMNHGNSGQTYDFTYMIAGVCGIALLWLGLNRLERFRVSREKGDDTPQALFAELCEAHGLTRGEKRLLQQAAGDAFDECCQLFIDPRRLGRLSLANSPEADRYAKLSRKLFGELGA